MKNIHLSIESKRINSELLGWSVQAWKKFRQDITLSEFYGQVCRANLGYDFIHIPYNRKRALKRLAAK